MRFSVEETNAQFKAGLLKHGLGFREDTAAQPKLSHDPDSMTPRRHPTTSTETFQCSTFLVILIRILTNNLYQTHKGTSLEGLGTLEIRVPVRGETRQQLQP